MSLQTTVTYQIYECFIVLLEPGVGPQAFHFSTKIQDVVN